MCNVGWVGEDTRVGIPRIAAYSTARTFTVYVGAGRGTREHRFLIVSVPDTKRSCHVIVHRMEEPKGERGQTDFHRSLDRRFCLATVPIRYQICTYLRVDILVTRRFFLFDFLAANRLKFFETFSGDMVS